MIAIIRIRGLVGKKIDVENTMERLGLKRKFVCVVVKENPETIGMIKKIENFVAYGKISKETFLELVKKRGESLGNKIDVEKIGEYFEGKTGKSLKEIGIKPFFRLHPPRGGIETKARAPKGVLGKNDKINELIMRML